MCGIFAYAGSSQGQKLVLKGLKDLEYRGYDSWGLAFKTNDGVWVKKDIGKIGSVSDKMLPSSKFGFGHTRWATHGGVTVENSHPHSDCTGDIFLVHNGIIENYQEIKNSLGDHKYVSQTDSEILVHLIEEESKDKDFRRAVSAAFNKIKGLSAIIAFHSQKDEFVVMRNGSPLVLGFSDGQNYIASDPAALIPHTDKLYFLEDGQGAILSKDGIVCFTVSDGSEFEPKVSKVKWKTSQVSKGKHQHFMIKEIYDQKKVVRQILTSSKTYQKAISKIKKAQDIVFLGCGTSYHAAMIGSFLFSNIGKKKSFSIVGSELTYYKHLISKNTLIIALSQSGETMDIIESVKMAKSKGASILSLVNVEGSTLYRMSDEHILLQAGPEKAVASTKSFIAKVAHLYVMAHRLSGRKMYPTKIIKSVNSSLSHRFMSSIKKLSYLISSHKHLYIVGRGSSYPISLETALKIKELSYIHAEGFAAGELKHGVIALIEEGTPCIVYAPKDESYWENIAAAMELKARGAYIIGVSPMSHEVFDFHIKTLNLSVESMFQDAIVGQLLSYYLSVEKGLDPDMPRNLAKSVTVK